MIDQILNGILLQLNTYIGTVDPEVILGNISFADAFQDSSSQNITDKVVASVINIEQENSLRNLPFKRTVQTAAGLTEGIQQQPEIFLNVYVLFSANKSNYGTALQRISQVIAFFQRRVVFTQANTPVLVTLNLDKVIFDLYSTRFEELNQLWSIMGGKYIPSVVYKMRLAVIQDADEEGAGLISEIRLRSKVLSTSIEPV